MDATVGRAYGCAYDGRGEPVKPAADDGDVRPLITADYAVGASLLSY